ncbi:endonuclease/exonuclease/phosphatase family protein [Yoonia sp. BS5-3]|uniref:Endonuclease/exonuclease/phosphatase family protein n=1 Tax=Yoonia phaeophyticola TaxID=3137369 RepID=A0ABZ2V2W3_9RHOB
MIASLRLGLVCVASGLVVTVWAGFGGGWHPAADSLSLLRPVAGILCVLLMLGLRGRIWGVALGLTGGAALITTLPLMMGSPTAGTLTLYSKNIWSRNQNLDALAADISDSNADVVTLQEVSAHNRGLLSRLAGDYPYQHLCAFGGWSGIAVLAKVPIHDQVCSSRRGVAAAQIDQAGQRIWVGSVHLLWPFPRGNRRSADAVTDVIAGLEEPVVLAGDFNIFPWAASVRQIADAAGTEPLRPVRPTYYLQGVPLLLDHVYGPYGGQVSYRSFLGSDHLGVLATVRLMP